MDHFEDLEPGDSWTAGGYQVTKEEILEFAEAYDPQPFHVDEEAANESHFGGLVASGWHTCAITARLMVEATRDELATPGGRGVESLRWLEPVRPGDELDAVLKLQDKEDWQPGLGSLEIDVETQVDGDAVLAYTGLILVRKRE